MEGVTQLDRGENVFEKHGAEWMDRNTDSFATDGDRKIKIKVLSLLLGSLKLYYNNAVTNINAHFLHPYYRFH